MDDTSVKPSNNEIKPTSAHVSSNDTQLQQKGEVVQKIPVYQEDYSLTKEITNTQLHLEKKWINSTKKIEIPIKYEEMFINGKEFDSYSKGELVEIFSKIKEKISEVIHPDEDRKDGESINNSNEDGSNKKKYPKDIEIKHKKNEANAEDNKSQSYDDTDKNNALPLKALNKQQAQNHIQVSNDDMNVAEQDEQVITLWGEQIMIDKKVVKLGEIVIRKSKLSENRKIDVDVRNEKVTVKYPDGKKEEFQ